MVCRISTGCPKSSNPFPEEVRHDRRGSPRNPGKRGGSGRQLFPACSISTAHCRRCATSASRRKARQTHRSTRCWNRFPIWPDKVLVISRTLSQASNFNEVVRNQVQQMDIGERYEEITEAFNTIRDDAKTLVDQLADGKISFTENLPTSGATCAAAPFPTASTTSAIHLQGRCQGNQGPDRA